MTKKQLRTIAGENIRRERLARDMSLDELADMLQLTTGFVGLIERGQRGAAPITLYKLSNIFGVSIDVFFRHNSNGPLSLAEEPATKENTRREKINSLISDFTDSELDFIISMIKNVRAMNHSHYDFEDD